ncbi:hypothetical protein ISCGN_026410 [Ixodes scapularis]
METQGNHRSSNNRAPYYLKTAPPANSGGAARPSSARRGHFTRARDGPLADTSAVAKRGLPRQYAADELRKRKNHIHAFVFTTQNEVLTVPEFFLLFKTCTQKILARLLPRKTCAGPVTLI